jgi:hypothetical protein
MHRSLRTLFITATVASAVGLLLFFGQSTPQKFQAAAKEDTAVVLEAGNGAQWYRGNLHTHSLWSDGDDYLEMIALWYRDHDYDFLGFTDHNVLAKSQRWIDVEKNKGGRKAFDKLKKQFPQKWVDERIVSDRQQVRLKTFDEVRSRIGVPGKFLLIQGEEVTDRFKNLPIHMNVTNIKSLIPPLHGESVYQTMQNNVNAVIAQRERTKQPMFIHLNHPNFGYGVTAEDLMRVRGENFFEVYNGHPGVRNSGDGNHASTERIWDIILTQRLAKLGLPIMYGLGTDDGHNYHNIPSRGSEPGRGWVTVLSKKLTPAAIVNAMEAGRFYSSSGVEMKSVTSSDEGLDVTVAGEKGVTYTIEFIGTKKDFDPKSEPVTTKDGKELNATRKYSKDIGRVLKTVKGTTAKYEFKGDELYVRARVVSSKKHPNPSEVGEAERAWVQPVRGPAAITLD